MSLPTTAASGARPRQAVSPTLEARRFGGILAAEWTKLRSVRSTLWTLVITVAAGAAIAALITSATASRWSSRSRADQLAFDPTRSSLSGLLFAQLAIGVLGVLVISAEYGTGTIRATFAAVPRRSHVLAAKALVFGALVLVVGEITSLIAFLIGQHVLSGRTPTASLADGDVLRAVLGGGLYLTALGLFALGLAAIIRHTAAAISTFVGILFILPVITAVLPSSLAGDVNRFLPADIGTAMLSAHRHSGNAFGPWLSFGLLAGYAVAALLIGGVLLVRRDA